jgi:CYTH domain-containing protein
MAHRRRFLIASSLARLIRRERPGTRVTEGYFPDQPGRSSHVQVEGDKGSLILVSGMPGEAPAEERTEVPAAHAAALLDIVPGKVEYARSRLAIADHEIWIDRFITPGPLDLVSVEFEREDDAMGFSPPPWFGPEVTDEAAYQNRAITLGTLPKPAEPVLSNGALDSLLDALEYRFRSPRPSVPARAPAAVASPAASGNRARGSDLAMEDDAIRELARSLRPQRG